MTPPAAAGPAQTLRTCGVMPAEGADGQGRGTARTDKRRNAGAVEGVTRRFGSVTALEDLSLAVGAGEVLGVVGASGCGKSTLLELVAGLQEPDAGTIDVGGSADRRDRCAYMPQRDLLLPWRDAVGNAALALECQGISGAAARDRARPLFERFGLAGFERARPAELSGGMRQRVAFMRTLLAGRPVLLLDEPFASLDAITRADMHEWLGGAGRRAADRDPGDPRRRGGRAAVRPGRRAQPRPGRVVAELDVPVPRAGAPCPTPRCCACANRRWRRCDEAGAARRRAAGRCSWACGPWWPPGTRWTT